MSYYYVRRPSTNKLAAAVYNRKNCLSNSHFFSIFTSKTYMWEPCHVSRYSYGLKTEQSGFDSRQGQRLFSTPLLPRRLWGPPPPHALGFEGFVPGGKAAGA
jgi:hypothetical protein